jgi:hypothetical protein
VGAALTADDLNFAKVRARHIDPPEQVAAHLIEAAGQAERLTWVPGAAVLIMAADVLRRAGDHGSAVMMLQRMLDDGIPDQHLAILARTELAKAFVGTGGADGAEVLFLTASAMSDPLVAAAPLVTAAESFTDAGYYEHAMRCANAIEARALHHWRGGSMFRAMVNVRYPPEGVFPNLEMAQVVRDKIQMAEVRGKVRARGTATGVVGNADNSECPPVESDVTLWWPEDDYLRLERQLPELTAIIGSPWRQHIAQVEASLRDRARRGHSGQRLLRAGFDDFAGFLMVSEADPRSQAALDEFATPGRPTGDWLAQSWATVNLPTQPWPLPPGMPCWCGSGAGYQYCCGRGQVSPGPAGPRNGVVAYLARRMLG